MRTLLVGMVGGLAALVGFAGAANADSLTLRWQNTGTNVVSTPATSSNLILDVELNVGAGGTQCGGVTVDYGLSGKLTVTNVPAPVTGNLAGVSNPDGSCAFGTLGNTTDTGSQVRNVNGVQFPAAHAGTTIRLGEITFHKTAVSASANLSMLFTSTDLVENITSFGTAQVINAPEPAALALLGLGFGGLILGRSRKS